MASRALTLPSRGRATSGFAGCRPPLMSNVRALVAREESIAVVTGRPRSGRRTFPCSPRGPSSPSAWAVRPASGRPANDRLRSKRGTVASSRPSKLARTIGLTSATAEQCRQYRHHETCGSESSHRSGSRVTEIKCRIQTGSFVGRSAGMRPISRACQRQAVPRRATPKGVRRVWQAEP